MRRELTEMAQRARLLISLFNPELVSRMDEPVGNQSMIDRRRYRDMQSSYQSTVIAFIGRTIRRDDGGLRCTRLMNNLLEVKRKVRGSDDNSH